MKSANIVHLLAVVVCCLFGFTASGQSPIVKDMTINANEARIEFNANQQTTYLVEISGPLDYYYRQEVAKTSDIKISPNRPDGSVFEDGSYRIQLTPVYTLTDDQRNDLIALSQQNDQAGIQAYRDAHNLPTQVEGFMVNFGIRNGKFIEPNKHEGDLPPPTMFGHQTDFYSPDAIYASVNYIEGATVPQEMDKSLFVEDDVQTFTQDVVVQGSMCVGIDCSTSESFGFDTERLKENNLRLHFDDTSNSASFPSNDWRIVLNDSENGGANYFAIQDATGNRTPFLIEAGASNNALYVESDGDIGIGTSNPVVETHVVDGDSPTLRLEQDGSSGFTSQTWDIAGNETNFFVRNVTSSSHLSFRILAGSGTDDAIVIAGNGNVGLGDDTPDAALDIELGDVLVTDGDVNLTTGDVNIAAGNIVLPSGTSKVGINVAVPTVALDVVGPVKLEGSMSLTGNGVYRGNNTFLCTENSSFRTSTFSPILYVDATNTRIGIGKANPGHLLELSADDAVKPNGGSWSGPSDRRLKTDIRDFKDGLSQLMAIRPVRYHYNGLLDLPTDKEFIGVIAQEIQKVAPYTVRPLNHEGGNGEDYLAYDGSSLTYILVNAVQEQQNIIDSQEQRIQELEANLSEVAQLREEVAALAKILKAEATTTEDNTSKVSEDK